jgi:acyl-CoA dehydrogenase
MHGYLDELRRTVASVTETNDPAFGAAGARLGEAVESLDRATTWLIGKLDKSPDAALAGAAPYLRLFASAAGGCMLAENALAESRGGIDGGGRVALARFFAENISVQAGGLETTITEGAESLSDAALRGAA